MTASTVKIDSKKYRIISESDYMALLQDIKDLKKVLKRRNEKGMEAREFFKNATGKSKA